MHVADPLPILVERVVLRRLTVDDLEAFQGYRRDPVVGRYQGWSAMPDQEACAFLLEMSKRKLLQPGEWCQIAIAEPDSLALVGDIGVRIAESSAEAEIGFTLSREAQGRGIATSAVRAAIRMVFEHTPVERIIGITDAQNVASVRLLERIGMRRVDSHEVVFRGEPCVEVTYALARHAA